MFPLRWKKWKRTTEKVEPLEQFPQRGKINISEKNSSLAVKHSIPEGLIINLDQTSVSFITPGKYTFDVGSTKTVPVKGQITATFSFSMSGKYLPTEVIYGGKTKRYLMKCNFPVKLDFTFSENYWSSTGKSLSLSIKIVFPHLKRVRH